MNLIQTLRDLFLFDWLFGKRRKNSSRTNPPDSHDCNHDYGMPRYPDNPDSFDGEHSDWDGRYLGDGDAFSHPGDDYAGVFGDFDDDF